jgi:type IV pilus assembly protein PilO
MKKFNLTGLSWYVQAAVFGGLAAALYLGFWFAVTRGIRAEASTAGEEAARLKSTNAKAQAASQRVGEFRAAYARAQADYSELLSLLPEHRELTNVLQGVQDRAKGELSVRRFTPKDDFLEEFYAGKPIEVEVSGSYNKLGQFFSQMAAYQRIVSISDFKIMQTNTPHGGRTVDGQFLLTAYYVSNEQLQKQKEEKEQAESKKKKKKSSKKDKKPEAAAETE